MNAQIDNKTLKDIKEFGYEIGIAARYLKTLGATDKQIETYVTRSHPTMPLQYVPFFKESARKGYVSNSTKLSHPIYNLYKSRLADMVNYWNNRGV